MINILKRDGSLEGYKDEKIISAVSAAAREAGLIPKEIGREVRDKVLQDPKIKEGGEIDVEHIQDLIESALMGIGQHEVAKRYIIYREDRARLRKVHPDPTAISDYIMLSKYSRFMDELGRRENTWGEVCDRNMYMHIRKYPELEDEIRSVYSSHVDTKISLPSMRSLQFAGKALEANHARMYNCSFTHADRPRFFQELLYLLLSGCGCGYSVQARHISRLPQIISPDATYISYHTVEDTIKGWAEAMGDLIKSHMTPGSHYVEFIWGKVRNKGSELITTGGKAPGHIPLKKMIEGVRSVLEGATGRQLTSFETHRICCVIARYVVAGGIRRSSLICLFDNFDEEMLTCKSSPDWYSIYPELAQSNNSAIFLRGKSDNEGPFRALFKTMQTYGEPGFFFTTDLDYGTNPCGEIGLNPVYITESGDRLVGWSFCNLNEINATKLHSQEDFLAAAKAASFLGTLQAGYRDFPYLGEATRFIADRDSLLGVSITGIMDNAIVRDKSNQREAAAAVCAENERVSKLIGILPYARGTTVKPSGTCSLLLGGIGSGHHEHHARRSFRLVTANELEPVFQQFRAVNPHMCFPKGDGSDDWFICFPMEADPSAILRGDLTAIEFMECVMSTFENWIVPGTIRDDLTHNVSCTVTVKDHEWGEVADYAWENRDRIGAMAFLPWLGDKVYANAPRQDAADDIEKWVNLIRRYRQVDYNVIDKETDFGSACEGIACEFNAGS